MYNLFYVYRLVFDSITSCAFRSRLCQKGNRKNKIKFNGNDLCLRFRGKDATLEHILC